MNIYFKTIITAMATTMAFSACSDFDGLLSNKKAGKVATGGTPVATTFTATGEDMEAENASRTYISDNKYVIWEENDKISVFDVLGSNRLYKCINPGTSIGSFEGEAVAAEKYYAIYPYDKQYEYSEEEGKVYNVEVKRDHINENSTMLYPDDETPENVTYCPMMGATTTEDKDFQFKNITSRLDLNITGMPIGGGFQPQSADVTVTFSANSGETISGKGTLDWNNGDPKFTDFTIAYPYAMYKKKRHTEKTLQESLYIIPGIIWSGFTICIEVDNSKYYFHNNLTIEFKRNKIYTFNLNIEKANGIGTVDLGLPSGLLLDAMNIGSSNPIQAGKYYAYGELLEKKTYDWSTYWWGTSATELEKYVLYKDRANGKDGFYDGRAVLDLEWDAVSKDYASKGTDHRMPTKDEAQEIIDNTTMELVKAGDTQYVKCTSKINGKSVLFPTAVGTQTAGGSKTLFRVSTSTTTNNSKSRYTWGNSTGKENGTIATNQRCDGYNVRGVVSKQKHAYVDMGTAGKWATVNVGAKVPEDFGDLFAWGETETKPGLDYGWTYYKWGGSPREQSTKYKLTTEELETADDAATANWGDGWRTPSEADFNNLIAACNWTKHREGDTGYSGVEGWIGTLKTDRTKEIFFPCAGWADYGATKFWTTGDPVGFYWTRNLKFYHSASRFKVLPSDGNITAPTIDFESRPLGMSVRPIYVK